MITRREPQARLLVLPPITIIPPIPRRFAHSPHARPVPQGMLNLPPGVVRIDAFDHHGRPQECSILSLSGELCSNILDEGFSVGLHRFLSSTCRRLR
jgi:hypothetical protein